ncbi:hypothetical protein K438DRAFT_1988445 [Mycena galopus ATCC 62051]|nr:hypothetical protein K438DRAFT_1988445 [Mycena galopus ATCC 62051]
MFDGIERPNLCEADMLSQPKPWMSEWESFCFGGRTLLDATDPDLSAVSIGDNTNLCDTTFVDNAAHAAILAADRLAPAHPQHAATVGRAFLVSDDDPRPTWDLRRDLWAAASGTTPPAPVRVPPGYFAVKKPGLLARLFRRTGPRTEKQKTARAIQCFCATRTYNISLARDVLGYTPIVSHDEGIRRTAEWWNEKQLKLSALKNGTETTTDDLPPAYDPQSTPNLRASSAEIMSSPLV